MRPNKLIIVLNFLLTKLLIFILPIFLFSGDRLKLIHADILENKPFGSKSIQELRGNVLFKKGELELSCNKAIFDESSGIATLTGSINVIKNNMHLTCDSLLFLSKKDVLKNFHRVHIWDEGYDLTADSVIYMTEIDSGYANGNATLIQQKQTINADALYYQKNPKSESVSYEAMGNVVIKDGSRVATCGYALYDRDEGKNLLKIDPIITENKRILSGKEISLLYENEVLNKIFIPEKAHMKSPQFGWKEIISDSIVIKDSIETINDLEGKSLNGFFVDGGLDSLRIEGMATSIYHVFEDSIYKGINKVSGDTISMLFNKNEMNKILISGGAQGKFIPDSTNKKTGSPINYSSKIIHYFTEDELTHLKKNASIKYDEMDLTAGYIKMNLKSDNLHALPTVPNDTTILPIRPTVIEKGKEPMKGDEIHYNLVNKKGRIIMGETTMDDGYYYGDEIRNSGENVYYINESIFTTCDLTIPHFHFASDQMKMINEDKVVARPLILYVGGVPIFGIPFAVFPHQRGSRHSGWIMPTYGESSTRGQFLDGLGYYWAPNPFWDSKALISFADRQGITFKLLNRYNKRYNFSGNLRLETQYLLSSEKDITQIGDANKTYFVLDWSHRQQLRNDQKFNVNAKYYSNGEYNRNTGIDANVRLKQQAISNATYSKNWKKQKNSISINLSSNRDLMSEKKIDSTSVFFEDPYKAGQKIIITNNTLPSFRFRHGQSQLFPEKSTEKSWYNNISWNYSSNFNNKIQTYFESDTVWNADSTYTYKWKRDEDAGIVESKVDRIATHNFGINAPQKILKYISMNPSISIQQDWVEKTFSAKLDSSSNSLILTEKTGFQTQTTGSFRLSLRTQLYGMFPTNFLKLKGLRHVVTPSVSYSFTPDFSEPLFGYDFGYFEEIPDTLGQIILHDRYKGTLAGSTPSRKSQSMGLSLNNVFQAKIGEEESQKKIDLFSWNMSTSYNFVADSMKLSNLRSTVRTKLGRTLRFDLSMTHDFYKIRELNGYHKRINELNRLPRLINARISTGFKMSGKIMNLTDEAFDEVGIDSLEIDNIDFSNSFGTAIPSKSPLENTGKLWSTSLSLSYSLNKSNPLNPTESFWINTNTDFQVTDFWKVKYSARIDVLDKELVSQNISIYRDLHCWELSLNWTPTGFGRGVYLRINVKSPTFRDLKIEQKSGLYGRRGF